MNFAYDKIVFKNFKGRFPFVKVGTAVTVCAFAEGIILGVEESKIPNGMHIIFIN